MEIKKRIVPIRREGNKVFVRALERSEEDLGTVVSLEEGDELVAEPGAIHFSSEDVDDLLEEDLGGYKLVSPVIYMFSSMLKGPRILERKKILSAIGRWMDSTYLQWRNFAVEVDNLRTATGNEREISYHKAWGFAEQTIVMLNRLNKLVGVYNKNFGGIKCPRMLKNSSDTVRLLRNKIEHSEKEFFEGTTMLIPVKNEDVDTFCIFFCPDNKGDLVGANLLLLIQPLLELRRSVVDSLSYTQIR